MLLKVGSSGEDVKKLQSFLGLGADGSFGPGTERAVKAWQSANGLTADGVAGPTTLAKLGIAEVEVPASSFKLAALKTDSHSFFVNPLATESGASFLTRYDLEKSLVIHLML